MNVYELTEKLGGEIVRGKARIRQGGDYVVLGFLNGDDMIFTAEGRQLAAEHSGEGKSRRGRPLKSTVVESEQAVDPTMAEVEAAMVAELAASEEVPFPTVESASVQGLTE